MTTKYRIQTSDWLKRGFDTYTSNIGVLLPACLVLLVIAFFVQLVGGALGALFWPLYILLVPVVAAVLNPLIAGLTLLALQLVDKVDPKPSVSIIFKGFDYLKQVFLFGLVLGGVVFVIEFAGILLAIFVPVLGWIAYAVLKVFSSILTFVLMFSILLIVDRKMPFMDACKTSINLIKGNPWGLLGFSLLTTIIAMSGIILCGIGVLFTAPIAWTTMATAYRSISQEPFFNEAMTKQ